jgi:glycosyltransferase involved in cell wall biosynthesis
MVSEKSDQAVPRLKLGILASHPIQYQAPLFKELAKRCDLFVYYAQRQTPQAQAAAGFGVGFEWDVDLLSGYAHRFLDNVAKKPDTGTFSGCDTPGITGEIATAGFDAFLVMGWHLKSFWQAIRQCRRRGLPVMVRGDSQLATPRSGFKRIAKAALYPWVIRQFDACLYVGHRNRAYLGHYGAPDHRLFFSPHCIDTDAFSDAAASADRASIRAGWGLGGHDQAVLFAGKLVSRKRPTDLVLAAAQLRAAGRPVVLVWAGDGPERQALDSLARSSNVPMVFLGFCNQTALPAIYRSADALALPSDGSETWGLVVNEAMACGTPCVVSDSCGCAPDMIVRGETGQQYPSGNVPALAAALTEVLTANLSERPILARSEAYSVRAAAAGIIEAATSLARK